jgi:hypothetical protein
MVEPEPDAVDQAHSALEKESLLQRGREEQQLLRAVESALGPHASVGRYFRELVALSTSSICRAKAAAPRKTGNAPIFKPNHVLLWRLEPKEVLFRKRKWVGVVMPTGEEIVK